MTLGLGENVTCTFVNNDRAPRLRLVKEVITDNGGTAVASDWTLTATGYDAVSPDAGTYALSESGPAGYTQTSLTCSDTGTTEVTSVTLGLGEDVTCTFINDDNAPRLTLVKQVITDDGGTAVASDWTLTAAGYSAAAPQIGTYALSESGPAGYTQTSLTCSDTGTTTQVTSVTLGLGENVTCTFVNDDQAAHLKLIKVVTTNNGGTAEAANWTLTATGPTPISGAGGAESDVDAGLYTLSESGGPAGYAAGAWSCVGGTLVGDQLTLALGGSAVCSITNDDEAPSLTLVKQVTNDNGGAAVPGDWTLTATGYDAASPDAGTYDLSESGPAGYTQTSLTCSNSIGQVTTATLGLNEDVTCTFVNNDNAPRLTLVKQVITDNGGTAVAADWTLSAAGYDAASPDAGTYDLSESGPAGYTMTSLTCDNSTGQVSKVTLGLGENVTCTFVNDDIAPRLILQKAVVNDNGGTAAPGDWTLTAAGYDAASPDAGTYALSESVGPVGYVMTSLICSDDVGVEVSSVTLSLGETTTCRFTNNDVAPALTLVKTVVNDNGGTALPAAWTLTAAGYDPASPDAGTYDLSESVGPAGYAMTSLTCSNSTGQVTSVTLGLGENVTCTFVNDDIAPSLRLIKSVVNDNGGKAVAGDWTLTAAGYDATSPDAGTYNLSESVGPAGYTMTSLTCSNGTGQVTSVTLALGEGVTCIFVNNDNAPSLTLVKTVINDNGGTALPTAWTLTAAGYDAASPDAGTYNLSESGGPAGYTMTSLTCDNSTGQVTSVTLALGENVTCTFVNDDQNKLTLVKFYDANLNGVQDAGEPGIVGWQIRVGTQSVTTGAGGSADVWLSSGSYTATEGSASGWVATTAVSVPVTVPGVSTVKFGNVCLGAGGGRTLGFWSNRNGQAMVGPADLAMLSALNLVNTNGTPFDPADYRALRTWLLGGTATNMAYMLSVQMAAMQLNVFNGLVSSTSLVYAPGVPGANSAGFISISDLLAAANAALAADGLTRSGDANRALQEALKTAIDQANNNRNFLQLTPCSTPTTFRF